MKILVINPGSTSTKWGVYDDRQLIWTAKAQHSVEELKKYAHVLEQLPMRIEATYNALESDGIEPRFDAVIGRGGLCKPTPSGVYEVDDRLVHDLSYAELEHACNLGAMIARDVAERYGGRAFIADPEVVDEMIPEAKLTGLPEITRKSVFHALNTKAIARQYAMTIGRKYEELNLIMVHLGGGISVGAHRRGEVIDVNNALNGDGPFSPERAGTLPADQLAELCYSGKYTLRQLKQLLNGSGGLVAHLGTNDVALVAQKASEGEQPYKLVLDSMIFTVAKEIGSRSVALRGKVDAIVLTGGIAHSRYCVEGIKSWIDHIAPVEVFPGENELDALAFNAYSAMRGDIPLSTYNPD